ncbi:MAG: acetamidase/formamidase family protein [Aestuariivirga sp.]|uniref:acetamidase/formamidase family protein n=1 Tax=Aestuariivirga sp. TaxID=2650926 RepID=UPI0025BF961F|nr:acetamidase/formamidase family protein [Aestuariivirga sp.]MCA3560174.1 acetamidase/formamidase family protein [Aestuariivirga sp.]
MTTRRFTPTALHNTLGSHPPALAIASGDTVIAATADAHGFDRHGGKIAEKPNPMTGPFFIEGAEPGDALLIAIRDIAMTRGTGWTFDVLSPNVVDPAAVLRLRERRKVDWLIDAEKGQARLAEPPPALANWSVAVEPMIGCLGVAPDLGQAISTATSGRHGGNMDYRGFKAGVEVMFPVAVPGALFFLGDVHAQQCDGEIVGTGIETAAEVTFTARVLKGQKIGWPRGLNEAEIFTIGNARPLDQALQHATTEMLDWLMADYGLDEVAASHVMGQCVRYDVANVFNPAYSVACRVARAVLP